MTLKTSMTGEGKEAGHCLLVDQLQCEDVPGMVNYSVSFCRRSWDCDDDGMGNEQRFSNLICCEELHVISPDFLLELTGFFPGKHLIHSLVLKTMAFRNFVLGNCILAFDAEQVYLKL